MKKDKFLVFSFLIVVSLTLITTNIQAHSPSNIDLQYDIETQILDVIISHSVNDVNTHYIEEIKIWVNDVLNQTETYTNQTSTLQHVDSFSVATVNEDIIKVQATCSISGSLINDIEVGETTTSDYNIIFTIITLLSTSAVFGYLQYKKHNIKK